MAHTIRCARAKHDRCKCECDGAHHGEEATELDRSDPEPLPPVELPPPGPAWGAVGGRQGRLEYVR
jgi:hypothetical protein